MKIAMIVPGGVDRSGEFRVIPALLALLRELARDHELHVFAIRQEPRPAVWELDGAVIHNLGEPRSLRRTIAAIRAEHRIRPFAVVHAMWAGFCGAAAVAAAAVVRVPCIVHVTGGELVSLHDIGYGGCRSWRGRVLARATLAGASRLSCTSEPIRRLIAGFGREATRIALGIDLLRWPIREPQRRNVTATARLIHVASLNAVKDQTTLLEAIRLLRDAGVDFRLDIVGDDCTDGAVQNLSHELGLDDHVAFHGFMTQAQLRPLVESSHIAVFSSRHEAGPAAMLEAAAVGVPTVGTDVGHISEWNGFGSIAVPCSDPRALAAAIERVLGDEDLRIRLGREALARAATEDSAYTARCFGDIYRQLVAASVPQA